MPLTRAHALELGCLLLEVNSLSNGLADFLTNSSAGSPFRIHQIVHYLIAEDMIEIKEAVVCFSKKFNRKMVTTAISINDIILSQVEHLSEPQRLLLKLAAVIGQSFSLKEIMCICRGFVQLQHFTKPSILEWNLRVLCNRGFLRVEMSSINPLCKLSLKRSQSLDKIIYLQRDKFYGLSLSQVMLLEENILSYEEREMLNMSYGFQVTNDGVYNTDVV